MGVGGREMLLCAVRCGGVRLSPVTRMNDGWRWRRGSWETRGHSDDPSISTLSTISTYLQHRHIYGIYISSYLL